MAYLVYNVVLLLAAPFILLTLAAKKRCRRGIPQRLGALPASLAADGPPRRPLVWVHAVSLGEATAAVPLVRALHDRYPECRFLVTTVTETGREVVESRLAGIAAHAYAPLDFPWVVSGVLDRLRPTLCLVVETELWPNWLAALARRGVPTVVVNGRLSSRSFGRYRRIRFFMKQVLAHVTLALVQSERDRERFAALGLPAERIVRTGNLKFDQPLPASNVIPARDALGLAPDDEPIVAGSTHPVEEEHVLTAYRALIAAHPRLVLVLAPRHIERAQETETAARAAGFPTVRRSVIGRDAGAAVTGRPRVVILDTRGELASIYRYAVLAYVGGTLVPVGGHNLLEPAAWGIPVFFGPSTDHCAEVAALLEGAGGGIRVRDARELAEAADRLLQDRQALANAGAAARQVVEDNRGAIAQAVAQIAAVMDRAPDRMKGQGLGPLASPAFAKGAGRG